MDSFKNFLIAVQNDFIKARASSDYQSALMAREYGKNELLANLDFPVPRMKIKDVNIELSAFIKTHEVISNGKENNNTSNIKIISDTRNYFASNLNNFIKGEKQVREVKSVLNEIENRTIKYSEKYVKSNLYFKERVTRLTEYFSKKFEDSVLGIVKEYREKIDTIYSTVSEYVINENTEASEQNPEQTLDIEFSRNLENSEFAPVKINIVMTEDDLIWEIDKKFAADVK